MKKTALLLIPALALVAMTGCEDQDTTPVFQEPTEFVLNTPAYVNGVSERLFKTGLCLPSGPWVSDEDVAFIVDCIKQNIAQ